MRRFLLALALALVALTGFQANAWAQGLRINGGLDLQPLRPQLGFTVTVERPSFDLIGIRWGPIGTMKARTDFHTFDLELLTGLGGAAVLPNAPWAVKVKLLLHTQLQTGEPFDIGPDIQVTFSRAF